MSKAFYLKTCSVEIDHEIFLNTDNLCILVIQVYAKFYIDILNNYIEFTLNITKLALGTIVTQNFPL